LVTRYLGLKPKNPSLLLRVSDATAAAISQATETSETKGAPLEPNKMPVTKDEYSWWTKASSEESSVSEVQRALSQMFKKFKLSN
jgi:TPP-dependent trihydroxycyclohexane-1,2-dione (THcHDO) dehydratase